MPKLNFFTAVTYTDHSKSIGSFFLEKVDNYFFLGGKKAHVIQRDAKSGSEKVILSETTSSKLAIAGKVLSYLIIPIPLLMLIAKAILRSTHNFKLIDPKQKLEKGINVSEDTVGKIQGLMPKILMAQNNDEIKWLSRGNNLVFKLAQHPELVFKIPRHHYHANDETDSRFENMVKAKQVCLANKLGLLIIPHAKKLNVNVDGNSYAFIVEESLDFDPSESAQQELYYNYSTELNETARQLAIFVTKTAFNDVTWRNIPILKEAYDFQGPRRVALIDLEHMNSIVNGFIGDENGSCGLIGCLSEAQIDIVIAEARQQGATVTDDQARHAKNRRLQELESDKKCRAFYKINGIVTGKEPIQVDLDSLDLDLTEMGQIQIPARDEKGKPIKEGEDLKYEEKSITLRKVIEDVIAEINYLIENSPNQGSTKGKRYILLSTYKEPIKTFSYLGRPTDKFFLNKEEENQLWLRRIFKALVNKGYILKLDKVNGHGYFIQA